MGETEQKLSRVKQLNFNTVLHVIVLSAMTWIGNTLKDSVREVGILGSEIAVIREQNSNKKEQLDRIEQRVTAQQVAITDLQIEIAKIKKGP